MGQPERHRAGCRQAGPGRRVGCGAQRTVRADKLMLRCLIGAMCSRRNSSLAHRVGIVTGPAAAVIGEESRSPWSISAGFFHGTRLFQIKIEPIRQKLDILVDPQPAMAGLLLDDQLGWHARALKLRDERL